MSASRDREQPPSTLDEQAATPWAERSAFRDSRGITWWAASLLAIGATLVGTFVDVLFLGGPRLVSQVIYAIGCLLAILLVQRQSLFGPIVQPPLILGVSLPLVLWLTGEAAGAGMATAALSLAMPLLNAFPVMGITTVLTVGIGLARYFLQRQPLAVEEDTADKVKVSASDRPAKGGRPTTDRRGRSERTGGGLDSGRPSAAKAEGRGSRPAGQGKTPGRSSAAAGQARSSAERTGGQRRPGRPSPRSGDEDGAPRGSARRTSAAGGPAKQGGRPGRPDQRSGRPVRNARDAGDGGPAGGRPRPDPRRRPPRSRDDFDD
ncbi:hypothetical protein BKA25_004629 [Actinoalloteichus hymeniacidonis]|uniref:DUF6542 domain-containing protein n=1 Tax=Actinoalloteichus hymeniacidonis TaxID=340345 RepID=A0AAC9HM12_9PSEU|nr:hypothetical protein TL08_04215 [Actinoalloteichus hymeniacidonis]MBB5910313.1 hypothetical protein [Actinoalloteichus hymeniacidonis]